MSETIKEPSKKRYNDHISVSNRTKQVVHFVQQHDKTAMLEILLENIKDKQIVILIKSKKSADTLSAYLKTKEINALAIHGNHRVQKLQEASTSFNAKEINIIITTDMILKTLELSDIQLIINYDLPLQASEYFVRLAYVDEVGEAISLVSPEEDPTLTMIELLMKSQITEEQVQGFTPTAFSAQTKKDKRKKPRHSKQKLKLKDKNSLED